MFNLHSWVHLEIDRQRRADLLADADRRRRPESVADSRHPLEARHRRPKRELAMPARRSSPVIEPGGK
jgi:hypothetical protein